MASLIHATAVIDSRAELASSVRVGAYAVIGPDVSIGDDTEIGAQAQVQGPCSIGRENRIFPHSCIGFAPQDLKFAGETTSLEIGDRNQFREFCAIHRGTRGGGGVTSIGDDNLFMTYAHVGHDSRVGSRTVFAHAGAAGGHVEVADDATVGAYSSIHQFCRAGRHAYIGGYTVLTMDALPFAITVGTKPQCYGLNRIGLKRKGFSAETMRRLDGALRVLLRSGLNTTQALEELSASHRGCPEVEYLIAFVEKSERGIVKSERRGARGASAAPGSDRGRREPSGD
jgi:UDP-N-acetylglucosamine acyltransferase